MSYNKTKDLLKDKDPKELEFILNRYCTPHTIILCVKEFGFQLDRKAIYDLISSIAIDDLLSEP